MIVVTGATGHVGGLVAQELERRGAPMRLAVHTLDKAPKIDGAEVVSADYGDPDSLAEALGSIQQQRTARGVQGRWISPGTPSSVVFRGRSPGSGG